MSFDFTIFHFVNDFAGTSHFLDFFGIFFASFVQYLIVAAVLVALFWEVDWRKRWHDISFMALALLFSRGVIVPVIRFIHARPRPFVTFPEIKELIVQDGAEPSFPSGHMAIFFTLTLCLYYMGPRYRKLFYYVLAATCFMGVARIFVGVHYPIDIIGGIVVGGVSAFVARKMLDTTGEHDLG